MKSNLSVSIDAIEYSRFQSFSLERSLETLCASFRLTCMPEDMDFKLIKAGSVIQIKFHQELLFTGYVDQIHLFLSGSHKGLTISGRDKTCDLIDCSALRNPMGFCEKISLPMLAKELCTPFKIEVVSNLIDPKTLTNWYISYGETPFDCLERAARIDGTLLITDQKGRLVLDQPTIESKLPTLLNENSDILELDYTWNVRTLYSRYEIRTFSQQLGNKTEQLAFVEDESITRKRRLILDSEGLPSTDLAERRASFELKLRKARALSIQVKTPGWVSSQGDLFSLNRLLYLNSKTLGSERQPYLVYQLAFHIDDRGETADLGLIKPEAFFPDPAVEMRMNKLRDLIRRSQENGP